MQNKAHALAAGLFVVGVAVLLVLLAMWLLRDTANTRTYEMVSTEAVTGLQMQAAVRYKGVDVGRVTAIGFDPDQRSNVLVTLAIDENAPITDATYATLALQGITGLSFVQLDDSGSTAAGPVAAGPRGVPRIPLKPSTLGELGTRAGDLLIKVDQVVDALNTLLGPENQAALTQALAGLAEAVAHIDQLTQNANDLLNKQLDPARMDLPALVQQATQTLDKLGAATDEVRTAIAGVDGLIAGAQKGLGRVTGEGGLLERLDEGAGTVMQTTLPRIQDLTRDASRTIRRLDRLTNTLSENPQVLLFGQGSIPPGPGERGFEPPAAPDDGSTPLDKP